LIELLSKTYNLQSILDLEFNIDLILYALEKETEKILWEMWLLKYQHMDKDNFINFEDFKNKALKQNCTNKSYKEIEKEMKKIVKMHERR
jgi:hypothetical protein